MIVAITTSTPSARSRWVKVLSKGAQRPHVEALTRQPPDQPLDARFHGADGTLPSAHKEPLSEVLADWKQDLELVPAAIDDIPGAVHSGFLKALDSLWEKLLDVLVQKLKEVERRQLFITSHTARAALWRTWPLRGWPS